MTYRACMKQSDILAAVAGGGALTEALEAHLASCPSCRGQVEAAAFVRRLAETDEVPHRLPDPAVIWWKAQLLRRWQAERAVEAPLERMRWVEFAAGAVSLVVFLAWQWRSLVNLVTRAIPTGLEAAVSAPAAADPLVLVLAIGAAASIGAMVLAGLHRRLGGTTF